MPLMETLRALVQQRLTAAVEDILELFEKTITEYEEERNILHGVFKPQVRIERAGAVTFLRLSYYIYWTKCITILNAYGASTLCCMSCPTISQIAPHFSAAKR